MFASGTTNRHSQNVVLTVIKNRQGSWGCGWGGFFPVCLFVVGGGGVVLSFFLVCWWVVVVVVLPPP